MRRKMRGQAATEAGMQGWRLRGRDMEGTERDSEPGLW